MSKVTAVERLRNLKPQVIIRVHLHETVPFEVEQNEGVIRLALARRQPDTRDTSVSQDTGRQRGKL